MVEGVGPPEGIGKVRLHPHQPGRGIGRRARAAHGRELFEIAAGLTVREIPALRDLNSSENNDWTRFGWARMIAIALRCAALEVFPPPAIHSLVEENVQ